MGHMNELVGSLLVPAALAILGAWVGYVFGVRQERDKERRQRDHLAAVALVKPLRHIQRLLRAHGRDSVAPEDVALAFGSWSEAFDDHGHRLPDRWRKVHRGVRDAAGTVFGGVSLVHIRPDSRHLDLGEPDAMWQDFADDYIDYAAYSISTWGDSSRQPMKEFHSYDDWLVRTGRREPLEGRR